jgi:hypothetical protein
MRALRMEFERVMRNIPLLPVYPDYDAPIVRELDDQLVISLAQWVCPP